MIKAIRTSVIIFLYIVVASVGCRTSAKNESSKADVPADSSSIKKAEAVDYFKVAFISMGSGIDRQTKQKYDAFVKSFENENSIKMMLEVLRLGKEGETNYCFDLTGLSSRKQKKFIAGSQKILKDAQLVHTYLNARCH